MITKSDWQAVHEELLADERRKLGDPPTYDEALAYTRGELSGAEEERVRALLVAYPELALAATEPFPDDDPSDRELVSDDELAQRWEALERRLNGGPSRGGRVVHFPFAWAAAAAATLVFGGLWTNARMTVSELRARTEGPRAVAETFVPLRQSAVRGAGSAIPTELSSQDGKYAFAIPIPDGAKYSRFRIKIRDQNSEMISEGAVQPRPAKEFHFELRREEFQPGLYEVVLFGVDAANEDQYVAIYAVNLKG